jgi:hypothetical protein
MKTKYIKNENLEGGIFDNTTKAITSYRACTATTSKSFKTLKGAQKFMSDNGYMAFYE